MTKKKEGPRPPRKLTGGAVMKKRTGSKSHLKGDWLKAFKEMGTIGGACEAVDVSRTQIQVWRKEDSEFAIKYKEANVHITELLERSALTRAITGVEEPIYQGGKLVGKVRKLSDTLTIFLLKSRDKKYVQMYRHQLDMKMVEKIVTEVSNVIHKNVPQACPHCNNLLNLKPSIVRDLQALSKKFEVGE